VSDTERELERECRTFAGYLVAAQPNAYVRRKYIEAHSHSLAGGDRFDELLIRVARRGRVGVKLADSYARVFAPRALVRKKLVVLLAILETCAPSFRLIDDLDSNSRIVLLLRVSGRAAGFVVALAAAISFLFPAQLVLGRSTRRAGR
jgi:hypothetical protein